MRPLFVAALLVFGLASAARAEIDDRFDPVFVDTEEPEVFLILGEIGSWTEFGFRRAVKEYGFPETILLDSPGGDVHAALSIALTIADEAETEVTTVVTEDCFSACFYLFAAGDIRVVEGELGVHAIASSSDSLSAGQYAISQIIDIMSYLGVSNQVMVLMFATPAEEMYIFTEAELEEFGLVGGEEEADMLIADAGNPTAMPEPPGGTGIGAAIGFIEWHYASWSLADEAAMRVVTRSYFDQVTFYGQSYSREDVVKDRAAFVERWPARTYTFIADEAASFCNGPLCRVRGIVEWQVENPQSGAEDAGRTSAAFNLVLKNGQFRIVGETGEEL